MAVAKFPQVSNFSQLKKLLKVYHMSDAIIETTELPEDYSDIKDAVDKNLRLEIAYQHPKRGLDIRVIQPREIHRLGAVYYIIGFCERTDEDRTFRLDRIKNYQVLDYK